MSFAVTTETRGPRPGKWSVFEDPVITVRRGVTVLSPKGTRTSILEGVGRARPSLRRASRYTARTLERMFKTKDANAEADKKKQQGCKQVKL